jgi:hypothetical protein
LTVACRLLMSTFSCLASSFFRRTHACSISFCALGRASAKKLSYYTRSR